MLRTIRTAGWLLCLLSLPALAQHAPVLSLDTILQRIDRNNIQLRAYALKAEAYRYSADAATAWMAPMVGAGTFMTPYPGQKVMEGNKGSLMFQVEQDIPNTARLRAKQRYIASQGDIAMAGREVTLNDLRAQAKRLYYNWIIAAERIRLLQQNQQIIETMKKIAEVRYPYNQSQLGSIYKAEARVTGNHNMIHMQHGLIDKARAWLNSLMNRPGTEAFRIDTSLEPVFAPAATYDTAALAAARKDVWKMNAGIHSMQLNIDAMKQERKPDFKVSFSHMSPFGAGMPRMYSVMGMVSIPIVPWASRMYKNEVKAMELNVQSMEMEKAGMLQETQGMLYGMEEEIRNMQEHIAITESKIIPALQRTLDADFLSYQENRLELPVIIDAWEALTMAQSGLLDEKLRYYEMIVEYEKALYR
ncbi:TolC family protein [Chitinophaga japonensis]|uniref:Outer membrane protein TolC n=1 Tax=Chitinophaga japonensis TaxID=104662 RepID=A0A562T1B7_CHIJA|nr:TolC family protein [Chitinophaga japonensis]TWI86988.1 outer membrane protein TolC [Chitinophaga japonensis]